MTKINKKAFTLAEVLITLGIIGVVAALTIPNLIQNYQKKQWVSGLQKGYATLNQVFKTAMAEDLVNDVTQTELWNAIPVNEYGERRFGDSSVDYSPFVAKLQKYLKITKFCNPTDTPLEDSCYGISYVDLNGDEQDGDFTKAYRLKIYTADGMVYYFWYLLDSYYMNGRFIGSIEIDVNGDAGPNQLGRDLFSFALHKNGNVILPGTKDWEDDEGFYHWSDENSTNYCLLKTSEFYAGEYCGARIFENGWKMDY